MSSEERVEQGERRSGTCGGVPTPFLGGFWNSILYLFCYFISCTWIFGQGAEMPSVQFRRSKDDVPKS